MAVLYSRRSAVAHDDAQYGHFEARSKNHDFDFPDELSDRLKTFCHRGKPDWETEDERALRLHGEDLDRRRDPAALYDAVGDVTDLFRQLGVALAGGARQAPDLSQLSPEQLAELAEAVASAQAGHSEAGAAKTATGRRKNAAAPKAAESGE